jgi:type IV secretion system protein VirB1
LLLISRRHSAHEWAREIDRQGRLRPGKEIGLTPLELISICAPLVAPVTLAAVVQHESGGNPLAVHDNATGASYRPRSEDEAIALTKSLMAQGHSVDLGLGQINSGNLARLGQSVETIFQPCANLAATQGVLLAAWRQAGGSLPGALSIYNTGRVDSATGARYAASVYAAASPVIAAIPGGRLPNWVSREFDAGANQPVRGTVRSAAAVTPASSALRPRAGDLKPGSFR